VTFLFVILERSRRACPELVEGTCGCLCRCPLCHLRTACPEQGL